MSRRELKSRGKEKSGQAPPGLDRRHYPVLRGRYQLPISYAMESKIDHDLHTVCTTEYVHTCSSGDRSRCMKPDAGLYVQHCTKCNIRAPSAMPSKFYLFFFIDQAGIVCCQPEKEEGILGTPCKTSTSPLHSLSRSFSSRLSIKTLVNVQVQSIKSMT